MPLTAAEKQRRYRLKRDEDPTRREEYLRKGREKWKQYREDGTIKYASQLTEREQRQNRKTWREQKSKYRENAEKSNECMTPPASPGSPTPESQAMRGRKKIRKDRSKCYRDLENARQELKNERKRTDKYRKRLERLRTVHKNAQSVLTKDTPTSNSKSLNKDTPRSKTKRLLRHIPVDGLVRKQLEFHYSLVGNLRSEFRKIKKKGSKRNLFNACAGIKKKYTKAAQNALGISGNMWYKNTKSTKTNKPCNAALKLKAMVEEFYAREDVSRITTGKKETKTVKGTKCQKRFLTDTMKNLHVKFLAESPVNMSYSMFCKLRPFWVIVPTVGDRQTCLCKLHDNTEFEAQRLKIMGILKTDNLEHLTTISCNVDNRMCMYGKCSQCSAACVPLESFDIKDDIWWWQWINKVETKVKNGKEFSFSRAAKENVYGGVKILIEKFQSDMLQLKTHVFNIRQQYKMYREVRNKIGPEEIIIHVDFAENYNCKYHREIQAVHFGGGHQQATLHTGVAYIAGRTPMSFCTISPNMQHGPDAIWSYLHPVLKSIKQDYPNLAVLHIFSDGPVTQYRQKLNVYLFSRNLFQYGFKLGTWNFFEKSHGKCAPDGIGGALKRAADRIVSHGSDIPHARALYEKLSESSVKLFYVEESESPGIPHPTLTAVPGTMKAHQIVCDKPSQIFSRHISCFCAKSENYKCNCIPLVEFNFPDVEPRAVSVVPRQDKEAISSYSPAVSQNDTSIPTTAAYPPQWLCPVAPSPSLLEQYCVVRYEGNAFPGIIQKVDEDSAEVRCMTSAGGNRWFFDNKALQRETCWYSYDDVLGLIPEPSAIGTRHKQIDPPLWAKVQDMI